MSRAIECNRCGTFDRWGTRIDISRALPIFKREGIEHLVSDSTHLCYPCVGALVGWWKAGEMHSCPSCGQALEEKNEPN